MDSSIRYSGTQVLNGVCQHLGATNVNGGSLVINDSFAGYEVDYHYNSLNQIALVATAIDYDTWAGGFGLNPATDGAPGADPDNDGLPNSEEYAFGLTPTSGSSSNPFTTPLDRTTGTFTYKRRNPSLTGLSYSYQSSTALAGWTNFTPSLESGDSGSPVETVTVNLPPALLAEPSLFIRVLAD